MIKDLKLRYQYLFEQDKSMTREQFKQLEKSLIIFLAYNRITLYDRIVCWILLLSTEWSRTCLRFNALNWRIAKANADIACAGLKQRSEGMHRYGVERCTRDLLSSASLEC